MCGRLKLIKCVTHDTYCQFCFEDIPEKDNDEYTYMGLRGTD